MAERPFTPFFVPWPGGLKIRRASRTADFVCAALHNRRAGRLCARDPPKTHIPHQIPVNKRFSLKFSVRVAFGIPLARHAAAHTSSWVLPFSSESTRCVLGPVLWRQLGVNGSWLLPFTPFFIRATSCCRQGGFLHIAYDGSGPLWQITLCDVGLFHLEGAHAPQSGR